MFILGLLKEQRQEEIYKERVQQVESRVCEFENLCVLSILQSRPLKSSFVISFSCLDLGRVCGLR